eukprot:6213697-Pleurochrysis_carterae.AAC.1
MVMHHCLYIRYVCCYIFHSGSRRLRRPTPRSTLAHGRAAPCSRRRSTCTPLLGHASSQLASTRVYNSLQCSCSRRLAKARDVEVRVGAEAGVAWSNSLFNIAVGGSGAPTADSSPASLDAPPLHRLACRAACLPVFAASLFLAPTAPVVLLLCVACVTPMRFLVHASGDCMFGFAALATEVSPAARTPLTASAQTALLGALTLPVKTLDAFASPSWLPQPAKRRWP